MITQTSIQCKNKPKNELIHILYLLRLKGYTQARIAKDLNSSRQVVNHVLHGRHKSKKVSDYINKILEEV